VFSEFCAGVHSWQTYWGDIAAAKEKEAKVAEKFLTYPLPAVQKWADVEISSALQQATLFRGEEDKWRC
jgi:CRISPR/Cas system-associated exonuclease Cas4 (RecB family)